MARDVRMTFEVYITLVPGASRIGGGRVSGAAEFPCQQLFACLGGNELESWKIAKE